MMNHFTKMELSLIYIYIYIFEIYMKYLFRTVLACKQFFIHANFSPDSDKITFSQENAILWTCIFPIETMV